MLKFTVMVGPIPLARHPSWHHDGSWPRRSASDGHSEAHWQAPPPAAHCELGCHGHGEPEPVGGSERQGTGRLVKDVCRDYKSLRLYRRVDPAAGPGQPARALRLALGTENKKMTSGGGMTRSAE
jgi:hypothetical protein